jgi:hypothetical protein
MIFRGESRHVAEAGVTPPAARRPLSAGHRTWSDSSTMTRYVRLQLSTDVTVGSGGPHSW